MKIIYLHQYFTTPDMPGGTRSYEMARKLVSWGHEVHIVTSWRKADKRTDWFEEIIDGIHVHWLPVPYSNKMSFWQRIDAFIRFAIKAGSKAKNIGGDIVFATSTPLTIAIPGAIASRRLKIPMVFEVRDLWPEVPIAMKILRNPIMVYLARQLEAFAYARSSHIVALSEDMAKGISDTGYPADKITVIPNGSDLELFEYDEAKEKHFRQMYPELQSGPLVLYPGTLGKVNGVSYIAHLAKGIFDSRPDVRFVVIGNGAEVDLVRNTAKDLGVLDKNFFLYAEMPKKTLTEAFSAASLVISVVVDIPALWANSANKFFDALASGTAVAINHQGWQARLLEATNAGIVLPPDPANAIQPLLNYLNSEKNIKRYGQHARKLAVDKFSREKLARRLENVLHKAILETQ